MGFTFTDADTESEFTTIGAGEYLAEISEVREVKNSMMLVFKSAENGDRLCNDFLHFSEKAAPFTARKLKQIGLEKVDGKYELSDDGMELVGKRVVLTLVPDENPKYLTPDFSAENHGYKAEDDIGF